MCSTQRAGLSSETGASSSHAQPFYHLLREMAIVGSGPAIIAVLLIPDQSHKFLPHSTNHYGGKALCHINRGRQAVHRLHLPQWVSSRAIWIFRPSKSVRKVGNHAPATAVSQLPILSYYQTPFQPPVAGPGPTRQYAVIASSPAPGSAAGRAGMVYSAVIPGTTFQSPYLPISMPQNQAVPCLGFGRGQGVPTQSMTGDARAQVGHHYQ